MITYCIIHTICMCLVFGILIGNKMFDKDNCSILGTIIVLVFAPIAFLVYIGAQLTKLNK